MKLTELLYLMCGNGGLFCMETPGGECLYCGEVDTAPLKAVKGYKVIEMHPERYGAYYGAMGITFIVEKM